MTILLVITLIGTYVSGLSSVYADERVCNVIGDKAPNYQLKRHVLCDYDFNVGPTSDPKNKTTIDIEMHLKFMECESWSSTLSLHVLQLITWQDPRLTWTPSDYGGVDVIRVKSSEIWTPELYVLNSHNGFMTRMLDSPCSFSGKGMVACIATVRYTVACDADYTFWPYDRHNCTLKVGIRSHKGDQLHPVIKKFRLIMLYREDSEWLIAATKRYRLEDNKKLLNNKTSPTVSALFMVKRSFPIMRGMLVSPAIILAILTMTALWFRPGSTERLVLSCTNLFSHLIVLRSINWHLPHTGRSSPNILLFYNNSLILSAVALILTCWLQRLTTWNKQVPPWLSKYASVVLSSKPGQILLSSILDPTVSTRLEEDVDDNSALVDSESKKSNWELIVTIVGWILLFSFLITYLTMFGVFFHYPANDDHLYRFY